MRCGNATNLKKHLDMTITWTNLIQAFLATQAGLFSFFLLSQRRRGKYHHVPLAGFLVCLAFHMGFNFVQDTGLYTGELDLSSGLGFLYGPFIYLYTTSLVERQAIILQRQWIHFLPAVTVVIVMLFPVFIPKEMLAGAVASSLAGYLIFSLKQVKDHETELLQNPLARQKKTLSWLKHLLMLLMLIAGLDMIHSILQSHSHPWTPFVYGSLILSLLALVIYIIFKALQQPHLFNEAPKTEVEMIECLPESNTNQTEKISEHRMNMEIIEQFMSNNPFAGDPDLSLDRFAERLNMPQRKVSEAINSIQNQSYSDYINDWRIREACRLLEDPAHYHKTILEILYEVGFSAKSNFYTVFKKKVGTTPVAYRSAAKASKITQKGPNS